MLQSDTLLHDAVSHVLSCLASRLCREEEMDCRIVAFEVGMQDGGGRWAGCHSPAETLVPEIFGTVMSVTGSALASWWRDRPPLTGP